MSQTQTQTQCASYVPIVIPDIPCVKINYELLTNNPPVPTLDLAVLDEFMKETAAQTAQITQTIDKDFDESLNIAEAKSEIIELTAKLKTINSEFKIIDRQFRPYQEEYQKSSQIYRFKRNEISRKIKELKTIVETENMFESVENIEGYNTLSQSELFAISRGMDKTDYRNDSRVTQRFIDLERLVREVIEFKKKIPDWILREISVSFQYDTLPPKTFYKFTYLTPEGHHMSYGEARMTTK